MKYQWVPQIDKTTPSGKRLFRCNGCGEEDPAPTKYHDCVQALLLKIVTLNHEKGELKKALKIAECSHVARMVAEGLPEQCVSCGKEFL